MTTDQLGEFVSALRAASQSVYGERLVSLAVYGSWARCAATPESDLDLLLVAESLPRGRGKRIAEFAPVEAATQAARAALWPRAASAVMLSPIILAPDEVRAGCPLFLDMTEACEIVHDREGFLRGYLDDLRRNMERLGTRKRQAKGGYYWDYKPGARPLEVIKL